MRVFRLPGPLGASGGRPDKDGWFAAGAAGLPNGTPGPVGLAAPPAFGAPTFVRCTLGMGAPRTSAAPRPVSAHYIELSQGSRGDLVRELQELLNWCTRPSPYLVVDGIFGPATARAVRQYQSGAHIGIDEIVGPITWEALLTPRFVRIVYRETTEAPQSKPAAPPRKPAAAPPAAEKPSESTAKKQAIKLHLMPLPFNGLPAWWRQRAADPYASEPFAATLTDGPKQGSLDGDGRIGYEQIPPGSCEFQFKEFYRAIEKALTPPS